MFSVNCNRKQEQSGVCIVKVKIKKTKIFLTSYFAIM